MRRFPWLAIAIALVLPGPSSAAEDDRFRSGLEAYFRAEFGPAVVELKRGIDEEAFGADRRPVAGYFLGRSFRELGLRGLALHYLGDVDASAGPWWPRAQLEVARTYFEVGEYDSVLRVHEGLTAEERSPEILYLSGIAAALGEDWPRADRILARVPEGDPIFPFALYARAQARAAREDFLGAIATFERVIAIGPPALADRARILVGKIHYLLGQDEAGREAFASVEDPSRTGLEVLEGLLLTGASPEAASRVDVSPVRAPDRAKVELLSAIAAEERSAFGHAAAARERLARLVDEQIALLDELAAAGPPAETLERDLAEFAVRLRRARWRERALAERELLGSELTLDVEEPEPVEPFLPELPTFYPVWERTHFELALRGLVDLRARVVALERDFERELERRSPPVWKFWAWFALLGEDEEAPLRLALLALRTENLAQLHADHLHLFGLPGGAELAERKARSMALTIESLRALLLGPRDAEWPEAIENFELGLSYKRNDIARLLEAIPDRSTDPSISLLGDVVDLLGDYREWLDLSRIDVPEVGGEEIATFVETLEARTEILGEEIGGGIGALTERTLRAERSFFLQIRAANEGSLSRLYARSLLLKEPGEK